MTDARGKFCGKIGSEYRLIKDLYRNVPGQYEMGLFRSAVKYFR